MILPVELDKDALIEDMKFVMRRHKLPLMAYVVGTPVYLLCPTIIHFENFPEDEKMRLSEEIQLTTLKQCLEDWQTSGDYGE